MLSTYGMVPLQSCLTTSVSSSSTPVMRESSGSASSTENILVELRRSLKCFSHYLTIQSVEVSSSPCPLKTVWMKCCFPHLSRHMICQKFFRVVSCSMAPPTSGLFRPQVPELCMAWPTVSCQVYRLVLGSSIKPTS